MAQSLDIPPIIFRRLVKFGCYFEVKSLIENPHTPNDVLAVLANSKLVETRLILAEHCSTPKNILELLAKDTH